MDKQTQRMTWMKNGAKILMWIALLIFFVYSFQTIIDWESIGGPQRNRSILRILTALTQPDFEISGLVAEQMWETIQIAFLATMLSAILAILFTFFSARGSSGWGRGFNFLLQPLLAVIRSIHPLIILIFAVIMVGIGPTAGVLALTLFSTAVLIEKFSEYARQHPSLRWHVLSSVHFPGLAFRHFSANFVIATILGFMGGGGIGFLLMQNINLLNYRDASVALLMIVLVGGSLDLLSRAVWHKIQKNPPAEPIAPEKVGKTLKSNIPLTPH